ncbi:AcrR family transcriptional regulator [Microbacterium proteolyticum]|uniref:AcrR family transcriptional regulator n=1 Tax=Microbacterium proteolyticum TaxID=1572644 RepID=A0A7W5GDH6_9MICO|nr:TetR/AcrR family transcriptional regulator [Microbacterium proteolyticum]MBB3156459.1 AcrR family transcriptional regulator [Microbacterium proteolyticum]
MSPEIDDAILTSTIDALSEVGFQGLSIAEVARRAGSTTPAVYRRFANKAELVQAAVTREMDGLPGDVADQGTLRADLLGWLTAISQSLTPQRTRILSGLLMAADPENAPIVDIRDHLRRMSHEGWTSIVRRATSRGELRADPAPPDLSRIPGGLIVSRALLLEPPMDVTELEELVDAVFLPALMAAATSTSAPESTKENS